MIRAYLREASFESSSDFAPVTTILPEAKISAVVLGSRIRMMTAANRCSSQYQRESEMKSTGVAYLWIVLCIASVERDCLEIEAAVKIDSCDDVPSNDIGSAFASQAKATRVYSLQRRHDATRTCPDSGSSSIPSRLT